MSQSLHKLAILCARAPAREPQRFGFKMQAGSADTAEIMIYDYIDPDPFFGGVSAADIAAQLRGITAKNIDLRVNCGGGDVFDAVAIHTALVQHPATVTAYVDGVAASAASFVVQAGDQRVIGPYAKMMIHNASAFVFGQASDIRKAADLLDDISATIAQIYTDRSGRNIDQFQADMAAETWYSAAAAVDAGLVDRVDGGTPEDTADTVSDRRGGPGSPHASRAAAALREQALRARARAARGI